MDAKLRVLIIDADNLLRDGLAALLSLESDLIVAGAIGPGTALAEVPLSAPPDLVILETAISENDGTEAIAAVRSYWPQARVLVLTYQRDDRSLENALRAGVDAYLLKSDTRVELAAALRSIKEGTRYVSPTIFDRVVTGYVQKYDLARRHESDGLSTREREVLRRIAQGHRTREIARDLSLSHKTIEKYRSNLMRKLGLRSAAAVAAFAIANGYLER